MNLVFGQSFHLHMHALRMRAKTPLELNDRPLSALRRCAGASSTARRTPACGCRAARAAAARSPGTRGFSAAARQSSLVSELRVEGFADAYISYHNASRSPLPAPPQPVPPQPLQEFRAVRQGRERLLVQVQARARREALRGRARRGGRPGEDTQEVTFRRKHRPNSGIDPLFAAPERTTDRNSHSG